MYVHKNAYKLVHRILKQALKFTTHGHCVCCNSSTMQCDEQTPWHLIQQQYCEFSQQNHQLSSLLPDFEKGRMESINAQNKMEDGISFQIGSKDWADCKRYIDDLGQWLFESMGYVKDVNEKIIGIFSQLQQTLDQQIETVEKKTTEWKTAQRLAMLGRRPEEDSESESEEIDANFQLLRQWYEEMEKAIVSLLSLINQYSSNIRDMSKWDYLPVEAMRLEMEKTNLCEQLQQYVRQRQHMLMKQSFIVSKQPPTIVRRSPTAQVTRTRKKSKLVFDLELRVLAGASYGLLLSNVQIDLHLISEKQAQNIVNETLDPFQQNFTAQELNPQAILQPCSNPNDGKMVAVFRDVRVQSTKNQDAEENEVLYHILFRTKPLRFNGSASTIPQFWTISTPFSIVTNAHRQDQLASARAFWRMAFKTDDRTSLANVDKEIRWCEFFPALDQWFRNTVERGCHKGLMAHSAYIAGKLGVNEEPESVVTWDTFYKKKLGGAQLTFWKWLYPIADYLAQVPKYWNRGLILGFISRVDAERLLLDQAKRSAMVLRFSESNAEKMVVSYFVPENNVLEHILFDENLNKALEGKTLAECIQLSQNLSTIECILPNGMPVSDLFDLDPTSSDKPSGPKSSKWGYVLPRVALVWDPLPSPPECLRNVSMPDESGTSTCADTLNDVEFEEAAD